MSNSELGIFEIQDLCERLSDLQRSSEACLAEINFLRTRYHEETLVRIFESVSEQLAAIIAKLEDLEGRVIDDSPSDPCLRKPYLTQRYERLSLLLENLQPLTDHSLRGRIHFQRRESELGERTPLEYLDDDLQD